MDNEKAAGFFLRDLFGMYAQGFAEFRALRPGGASRWFVSLPWDGQKLRAAVQAVQERSAAGFDVYVGVLPRIREAGDTDAIEASGWLWADLDEKNMGAEEIAQVCASADMVVCSGHGRHVYWRMDEVLPLPQEKQRLAFQKALRRFQRLHAGPQTDNVADLPRILRVPGTLNYKGSVPVPVTLEKRPEKGYIDRFPLKIGKRETVNSQPLKEGGVPPLDPPARKRETVTFSDPGGALARAAKEGRLPRCLPALRIPGARAIGNPNAAIVGILQRFEAARAGIAIHPELARIDRVEWDYFVDWFVNQNPEGLCQ